MLWNHKQYNRLQALIAVCFMAGESYRVWCWADIFILKILMSIDTHSIFIRTLRMWVVENVDVIEDLEEGDMFCAWTIKSKGNNRLNSDWSLLILTKNTCLYFTAVFIALKNCKQGLVLPANTLICITFRKWFIYKKCYF